MLRDRLMPTVNRFLEIVKALNYLLLEEEVLKNIHRGKKEKRGKYFCAYFPTPECARREICVLEEF